MIRRVGNNPKRRVAPFDRLDRQAREALADSLSYIGSAFHKRRPGDYGFHPAVNPRPWKSLCDGKRSVLLGEAQEMLRCAVLKGMFSDYFEGNRPKYVWAVDTAGDVYEAKTDRLGYHGYRLEDEDEMRRIVLDEWERR